MHHRTSISIILRNDVCFLVVCSAGHLALSLPFHTDISSYSASFIYSFLQHRDIDRIA